MERKLIYDEAARVWREKEEPYRIIECPTQEDYQEILAATEHYQKRGTWEYYGETTMIRSHFRCSVCNTPRYEHYACNDFKYCPNCGARMDLEARNETD